MRIPRATRMIVRLQRFASRPWYLPMIASLIALDLFVGFIPSDGLVVSSALLKPRRWIATSLWATTGSALGALALGALAGHFGEPLVRAVRPGVLGSSAWLRVAEFLRHYGPMALAAMAFGPLPQQPAVAICGLAHMPLLTVFLTVFLGRGAKYSLFAWSASHAPRLLRRWRATREAAQGIDAAASAQSRSQ